VAGVTVSHEESDAAVKFSVPVPVLVTLIDAATGFVPPEVPVNAKVVGETDNTGCATVSVTVTTVGEF
jgi:hypothetical protein